MESKNLLMQYRKLILKLGDTFYDMENYVLENYKKVPLKVWNDFTFNIVPHLGKEKVTFGRAFYEPRKNRNQKINDFLSKSAAKRKEITEITFTRDPHDGEFSVGFGKGYWSFLCGDRILPYYKVVYGYLNE